MDPVRYTIHPVPRRRQSFQHDDHQYSYRLRHGVSRAVSDGSHRPSVSSRPSGVLLRRLPLILVHCRPLLMISSALQVGIFASMGALGTVSDPSRAVKTGATVMLTLFGACLQFSWSPLFHAVVAEVPTQRLRDQTYAVGCLFNVITQWTVSFSMPYLLFQPRNLGPQVGFIFMVTSFISLLFAYFCIPECFGKTLEEVDQLFLEQVPIRKFRNIRPTLLGISDSEVETKDSTPVVHEEHGPPKVS